MSRPARTGLGMLLCAAMTLACEDAVAPHDVQTIALDVRSLTAAGLENGVSVSSLVRLQVEQLDADINVFTGAVDLAATDSVATFDVTLPRGAYRFTATVLSNNNTPLYLGSTVSTSDRSPIVIVPQALTAVMVVSPASATANDALMVRNVGSQNLTWVACVVIQTACSGQFLDPERGVLPPGGRMRVDVGGLPRGTWTVRFASAVGTLEATKTF